MQLQELTSAGKARVRRVKRAQILLFAEQGHGDAMVAATVGVGTSAVYRTKRRFVEQGLEAALSGSASGGWALRKLTGREEALLVAVACSDPLAGRARWTLELLAEEMVVRTGHEQVSRETVRGLRDPLIFCFRIDAQLIEHAYRSKFLATLPSADVGV